MTHGELCCSVYLQKWRHFDPQAKLALCCHRAPHQLLGSALTQGSTERGFGLHTKSPVMGLYHCGPRWRLGHVPVHVQSSGTILPTRLVLPHGEGEPAQAHRASGVNENCWIKIITLSLAIPAVSHGEGPRLQLPYNKMKGNFIQSPAADLFKVPGAGQSRLLLPQPVAAGSGCR